MSAHGVQGPESYSAGDCSALQMMSAKDERIVRLVAEGFKNREIAERLGMTECAVKARLVGIYNKAGMWNRVELALWYLKHAGLVLALLLLCHCALKRHVEAYNARATADCLKHHT